MSLVNSFAATGERIAELRGELTQAAFARRLGVDRKTVVRWEAGERLPDGASLLALVEQFGADLNYLLTGERVSDAPALTPEERAMLDNFRHADAVGRTAAQRVLNPSPQRKKA